ncbi:unnamed protein product [Musa hybrid cultivar]
MIYDVNSPLFRSFLSQKGGSSGDKRYDSSLPSRFLHVKFSCFLSNDGIHLFCLK